MSSPSSKSVAVASIQNSKQSKFFVNLCHCQRSSEEMMKRCVDAARVAMTALGPAHTERAYEDCMVNYFYKQRIPCLRQRQFFHVVDGQVIPVGVADLEVNHSIVLELKANLKEITDDHKAQLCRYLRAANVNPNAQISGAVILFAKNGSVKIWQTEINSSKEELHNVAAYETAK